MKKFVLAPALAALAMFVFGAIYWMTPLPYHALGRVADDSAAALELARIFPETGTYMIPGAYLDSKVVTDLMQRGPIAHVVFLKEGHPAVDPATFVKGYVHYFIASLLLALILLNVQPALKTYWCVVKLSTFVGLTGAFLLCLSDPIWWNHPWAWHLIEGLYATLAFTVSGLVLGAFFKPAAAAAPSAASAA